MSFEPPLWPPKPCAHPRIQVIGSGLYHCPACTTFWSQPKDVIIGQIGDREWVEIHDPDTGYDFQVALHASTARVETLDGTVLWQRA